MRQRPWMWTTSRRQKAAAKIEDEGEVAVLEKVVELNSLLEVDRQALGSPRRVRRHAVSGPTEDEDEAVECSYSKEVHNKSVRMCR